MLACRVDGQRMNVLLNIKSPSLRGNRADENLGDAANLVFQILEDTKQRFLDQSLVSEKPKRLDESNHLYEVHILLMKLKLFFALFVVGDLSNLATPLLLIFFPADIDFVLLLLGQAVIHLLRDIELEGKGYASLFGWNVRIGSWVVLVYKGDSCLLLLPTSEDDGPEGGRPSVRTIRLDWREFPLFVGVEFETTVNLIRIRPATVVEPVFDLLHMGGVSTMLARQMKA